MKKDDTHKQVIFSDKKIKVYEKIIKDETAEKKRELNRALDNKVDEVFDKKYQLFLKDIKIKKDLETLKKATKALNDFERSIENKKQVLKDAVKSNAKKVETICEGHRCSSPSSVSAPTVPSTTPPSASSTRRASLSSSPTPSPPSE